MIENKEFNSYYGISYAQSIIGKYRWCVSRLHCKYDNSDVSVGFISPQVKQASLLAEESGIEGYEVIENEQCLNLNIFTPPLCYHNNNNKNSAKKRPVMVWIHGGGFQVGSNALAAYNGKSLAQNANVIVVTINYRLGSLGFLRLCDVTNGEIPSTGNEGLSDQITALQWLQRNIEKFGGDQNNITLFGESAGAMSIACLLASPRAKGLFHKTILQSGAGHNYSSVEKANNIAKEFIISATALGYSTQDLKTITAQQLMAIQAHFLKRPEVYQQFGMLPFSPVIEESLLPIAPHIAIKQGCAKGIPILAGTNTDEWTLFAAMIGQNIDSQAAIDFSLAPIMTSDIKNDVVELAKLTLNKRDKENSYQNILSEVLGNYWFSEPCHRLLANHASAGGKSYRYLLGRKTIIEALGSTHGTDIGFVFGTTTATFHGASQRVDELVNNIQSTWSAFAYSGSPTTESLIWPEYSPTEQTNALNDVIPAFSYLSLGHQQELITQCAPSYIQCWSQISDQQLAAF